MVMKAPKRKIGVEARIDVRIAGKVQEVSVNSDPANLQTVFLRIPGLDHPVSVDADILMDAVRACQSEVN